MEYIIQGSQLLLGLSILVILHEFGHYAAAKYFGTKVESFYLFFNPWFSIWKKKIGETEYGIGWLPLGGYVKIAGMIDESMDKSQLEKPAEPWEFRAKPTWQRLIIMLGGVIMNVIVAFFIYAMVLFTWGEKYIPANNATYGIYCDSLMLDMGFQHNDKIVAIDGKPISDELTYNEIRVQLLLDGIETVTVDRKGKNTTIAIPQDFPQIVLRTGAKDLITEEFPCKIREVKKGSLAEKAGLQKGDEITAINEVQLAGAMHSLEVLKNRSNEKLTLKIVRKGEEKTFDITTGEDGRIGFYRTDKNQFLETKVKTYGFFESIPAGFFKTGEVTGRYIDQIGLIFSKEGVSQLGGFGTIAKIYGAEWVWQRFWEMTAMISVMLAVMNLLPIPALDGGHVMFLSYEMLTGRTPNEKMMEYAQVAGMIFLLAFMLYANGMDVVRAWF